MYLSQSKPSNFLGPEGHIIFSNKENINPPSKVNVFPPKMNRVASVNSKLYLEESLPTSFYKENKSYRAYSRDKEQILNPKSTINTSFNTQSDINRLFSKDLATHRYSCNIDIDKNSDNAKSNGLLYSSYDRRTDVDLQNRVKELQQKMRKNEQNLKYYSQEIQHFKLQISSSSSHLFDSINMNSLTVSTREPLRQTGNTQNINNKQNFSKNIHFVQSVTNSPRDPDMEKKLKQIDLIKKQLKKILKRQQASKGNEKIFHASIKQMLSNFRDYLQKSIESLTKRQQKTKKKIFDQISEEIKNKFSEIEPSLSQSVQKSLENLRIQQSNSKKINGISISKQRFLKDPILIKIKQGMYGLIKQASQVPSFSSYLDTIKRNMNESLEKKSLYSSLPNSRTNHLNQNETTKQTQICFEQAETTYYIDQEGFLLDFQGYYLLLDEQKIKLNQIQMQKLKQFKILPSTSNFN